LTVPRIGSDPKKVFVHCPIPDTVFWIHFEPEPYRTVEDAETLNEPDSAAIFVHEDAGAGAGALANTSHSLLSPTAGSEPKKAFVHLAAPKTVFVTHVEPAPKRTVDDVAMVNDSHSPATLVQDEVVLLVASADCI